jgi:hypothetical protein
MVVYVLPSVSGLQAWVDYIPVKGVATENTAVENTYANDGYQVMKTLDGTTNLQAWKDYIPVFEDASYNKPWSTDAGGYIPAGGLFSVLGSLFANDEIGVWFDPSDMSTLFQDSAGTTPVTAVEQPVGRMLDKSRGLVLGPEQTISAAALWSNTGDKTYTKTTTGFANLGVNLAPAQVGKTFVLSFTVSQLTAGTSLFILRRNESNTGNDTIATPTISQGASYAFYIEAKTSAATYDIWVDSSTFVGTLSNFSIRELPGNHATQSTSTSRPVLSARVNLLTDTETLATQTITTRATTQTLRFSGAGSITLSGTATGTYTAGTHSVTTTAGSLTLTVSGVVTQADLRASNSGASLPTYQRVTTSTDYDTTNFPMYLRFDGVDDWMVTPTITPGIDKMQIFAGVRKLVSNAGVIAEGATGSNNGTFTLCLGLVGTGTTESYRGTIRGSTTVTLDTSNIYTSPISNVLTLTGDISGDASQFRVNGTPVGVSNADLGTGDFLAYPLYIGRRGGSSLSFSGQLYSLITRFGTNLSTNTISAAEKFVAAKTGITI